MTLCFSHPHYHLAHTSQVLLCFNIQVTSNFLFTFICFCVLLRHRQIRHWWIDSVSCDQDSGSFLFADRGRNPWITLSHKLCQFFAVSNLKMQTNCHLFWTFTATFFFFNKIIIINKSIVLDRSDVFAQPSVFWVDSYVQVKKEWPRHFMYLF